MDQWIKQFWSELEQLGEDQVRLRLVNRSFSGAGKEEVALEWLHQKEAAHSAELERRRAEREAQAKQALTTANRAAEAGDRSTRIAEKLNNRTSVAIMIAVTALIVSILSLLAHLLK